MSVGPSVVAAAVTNDASSQGWPERAALTLAVLLVILALGWVLWWGWRAAHPSTAASRALPSTPNDLGDALAGPYKGRYLATVPAGDPAVPLTAYGLGNPATGMMAVTDLGVCVERDGAELLFIPVGVLRGARTETVTGGTPFGMGELVIISWKHGRESWETGFRAVSVRRHAEVVTAVETLLATPKRSSPSGRPVSAIPEVPL